MTDPIPLWKIPAIIARRIHKPSCEPGHVTPDWLMLVILVQAYAQKLPRFPYFLNVNQDNMTRDSQGQNAISPVTRKAGFAKIASQTGAAAWVQRFDNSLYCALVTSAGRGKGGDRCLPT